MGLEGVEILMAAEDAFGIQLDDAEVEKIRTPADLIEIVYSKVLKSTAATCLTQRAFNQTRAYFVKQRGLPRKAITPSTFLSQLIEKQNRAEWLRDYSARLGTGEPPQLTRPATIKALMPATACIVALATALLFIDNPHVWWLTVVAAFADALILDRATRRFRLEFPPSLITVGDLAKWLMTRKSDLAQTNVPGWTREQVACRIRQIVVDTLDCEKEYREEARFIEDLGMG